MSLFAPIELTWRDQVAKIPPNRVLGAIACIEEHITLTELASQAQEGRLRMVKVAQAYGAVLRYAGVNVADDEVYTDLYTGKPEEVRDRVIASVNALMALMIPPGAVLQGNGGAPSPDRGGVEKPSRNYTKRLSAADGSRARNSGKRSL